MSQSKNGSVHLYSTDDPDLVLDPKTSQLFINRLYQIPHFHDTTFVTLEFQVYPDSANIDVCAKLTTVDETEINLGIKSSEHRTVSKVESLSPNVFDFTKAIMFQSDLLSIDDQETPQSINFYIWSRVLRMLVKGSWCLKLDESYDGLLALSMKIESAVGDLELDFEEFPLG